MRMLKTILTLFILNASTWAAAPKLKDLPISVEVVDDYGLPVTNASVKVTYHQSYQRGDAIVKKGLTDNDGHFRTEADTRGPVNVRVEKEGYYSWLSGYHFSFDDWNKKMVPFDPAKHPVKVELKKVENPVSMFVKRAPSKPPVFGNKVGYDLEAGDWVRPHGSGIHNDFIYEYKLNHEDRGNYFAEMIINFANEEDGIQKFTIDSKGGSKFKSAKLAPESGYKSIYKEIRERRNGEIITYDRDDKRCFYFRVRTKLDEQGNVEEALYGKIYGDSFITGEFRYYLNLDKTRNLEFDPKRNLFKDEHGTQYAP